MPSTPILGITQVSTSQNGKEATINDAILALEEATNAKLVVSLAAGNATLTATEATRNFIFEAAGATAERELRFPMAVNGNPYNRVIVVRNESGHGLTVRFTDNGLTTVIIPNGESRLISADAATGMDVAAEPPSVISFLSLTDTPNTFTGSTGKFLTVNAEGTALEFVTGAQFPSLTGNANRFLMVNADGTGVEWAVPNIVTNFVALTDTPNSYSGQAGKLVRVNSASSGLEFITPEETEAVSFVNAARWRILALEPGEWPENPPGLDPSDPEYITPTDQVGFGEIEFLDLDGLRINIAGTASASNAQSGFEADRAFNEITTVGDGWRTEASYSGTVWIEFEFSTQVSPRRVRLTPINGAPQYAPMRFLIQYWDGAAWISLGDRTPASWESEVPQTFRINGIPLSTLSEAPQNSSLYGRFNGQWLKINAEAVTDSTTSYNLDATHVFQYRRFTNAGAKTLNIRTNATHAMPDDGEWFIYNATGGVLTIAPAAGVTVNAPVGGSLIVPVRGTVRIKRVGVNTYDLMGDTLSTESGGEVPPLIGNANRILSVNGDATAMAWIDPPITYTDEQARDAVGTALVAGTNVDINVNDAANTITISASGIGLDAEGVRDTIASALREGPNIDITINDAGDTITIGTSALDAEGVRDTIAAALVAGSNIAINANDGANTITIAASMDQEVIRDTIATALVAGSGVTIDHDDVANTITITSTGSGGGGDAEFIRDTIGTTLVAGSGITISVDDPANTVTISSTGGGGSGDAEFVRDTIGSALAAGSGLTLTINDASDTITYAADPEFIRDTIGTALTAGTGISISVNDSGDTITIANTVPGTDAELIRDTIGSALTAGSNVTITVNDLSDTITISAASTDPEIVRDTIGSALVAGSNVSIVVNDAANTITISANSTDPEVVRDTIGSTLTAGAGITITPDDGADTITIATTIDTEFIRDTIGTTLVAGTNVALVVDDAANTVTIQANMDQEVIRDTIATALVAGSNTSIAHDDAGNTITISATTDPEVVRDTIAATLVAGSNVTIEHDDTANTITISASGTGGGGGSADPEAIRDTIASALVAGPGINIDHNDAADTITISAIGGGGSGGALIPIAQIITTGSQTEAVFDDIPNTYDDLIVIVNGRTTRAGQQFDDLRMQVNGDTGANYDSQGIESNNFSSSNSTVAGATEWNLGWLPATSSPAGAAGHCEVVISNYSGTTFHKTMFNRTTLKTANTTSGLWVRHAGGFWRNSSAINSIRIFPVASGFEDGTVITVYARSNSATGNGITAARPTVVQEAHFIQNTAAVTLPSAPTPGNTLVVMASHWSNVLATQIANGWTVLHNQNGVTTDGNIILTKVVDADDTSSFTPFTVIGGCSISVYEVADASGVTVFPWNAIQEQSGFNSTTLNFGVPNDLCLIVGNLFTVGSNALPTALSGATFGTSIQGTTTNASPRQLTPFVVDTPAKGGRAVTATYAGTPTQYGMGVVLLAGTSGNDPEEVRDTIASALAAGSGISINHDDATDTITITATGTNAGGVQTPTIRAVGAPQYFNANSVSVTWPAGTQAGDTVVIFTHHGWVANTPSGWLLLNNLSGTNVNGATFMKVMSDADITAGSVLIDYTGVFTGVSQAISIVGAVTPRSVTANRSSTTGATSATFNADTLLPGDLILGYYGNRADSLNTLPVGWTTRTSNQNSNASSVFGTLVANTESYTGTATSSTGGAWYTSLVAFVADNTGSGVTQFLPIETIPDTEYDLASADAGRYLRFTATTDKVVTVRPDSSHPLAAETEWHFRNVGTGSLTFVAGGGVTINAPAGGSLVVPPNGVATLKRAATNVFDLMGSTFNAAEGVPYVLPFGFTYRPFSAEVLLIHVFAEDVDFPADFGLSQAHIGINPTTTATFSIKRNGTNVGSIVVNPTGAVSFATLGGAGVGFSAGDVLTVVAPDPADATLANCAFTLRANRI